MNEKEQKIIQRSPGYPAVDLQTAIEKTKVLYSKINKSIVHADSILEAIGYSRTGGAGKLVLAAMRKYGLIEYKGKKDNLKGKITELGLDIILDEREGSTQRRNAIKRAALSPELFNEMFEYYDGSIPDNASLIYHLTRERNFSDTGAKKFIEHFRSTIEFAELQKNDIISDSQEDRDDSNDKPSNTIFDTMKESTKGNQMNPKPGTSDANAKKVIDFPIPLSLQSAIIIRSSFPMSEDDWTLMTNLLKSYKNRLVEKSANRKIVQDDDEPNGEEEFEFDIE